MSSELNPGTYLSFGEWLRHRRGVLGLTQAALAQHINCALVTLRKFESEERRPSPEMAQRMVACLQIPEPQHEAFVRFARGELRAGEQLNVYEVTGAASRTDAANNNASAPSPHLPIPPYAIIGREDVIEQASHTISVNHARVLSLVGPPGVGKTRLALELAHRLHSGFAHGAVFVELVAVRHAALVPAAIAESLHYVRRIEDNTSADTTTAVLRALRNQHMLLVLDNFEHVIDAAPFVAELIAQCAKLVCLVTSRERLRIRAEHALQVDVLAVPATTDALPMTLDAVQAAPASRLFMARANEANAQLQLTHADAPAIAELCKQLDGLPLALELLAARADLFRPAELLADLQRGLNALETGPRDLPERHRGLRPAIEWSLRLLSADQQALFAHLAVFAGSVDGAAAQAVFAHKPTDLVALAHANLIQPAGAERWRMLEPIRQFAEEVLAREGDDAVEAVRVRHAAYMTEVAQAARAGLLGFEAERWTARLEADHANMQAALRWSLGANRPEQALRISVGNFRFWHRRGMWREGLGWLEEALQLDEREGERTPLDIRAKATRAAGFMAQALSLYDRTEGHFQTSLKLSYQLEDDEQVGATDVGLGILRTAQGRFEEALSFFDHAISIAPEHALKFPWQSKADVLRRLGHFDEAEMLYQQAMALNIRIGDDEGLAHTLRGLGEIAYRRGDAATAEKFIRDNEILCRKLNSERGLSFTAHHLGNIARTRGDWREAAVRYTDALTQMHRLGDRWGVCDVLTECTHWAVATRRFDLAAQWLGMAQAGFRALDAKLTLYELGLIEASLVQSAAHLAPDVLAQALAHGAQLWDEGDVGQVIAVLQAE